ncbi:hypothetical protein [Psychroserpens mesophilus]|uniref:hypothetical protein n=1 Tax=Psychroserpens mesophilus TaxID=325473 RepID=UPI003F493399
MNKRLSISILFLIISSLMAYGQQITFHKNVNYKANLLVQNLNKDRDSLFLESKTGEISQVVIFNDKFSKKYDIDSTKAEIGLKKLPLGNFIIQAKVDTKWIIMALEKTYNTKTAVSDLKTSFTSKQHTIKNTGFNHKTNNNNLSYYWVVYQINSSFGSTKSMRLVYKDEIPDLIKKNKLELKSNTGKNNKLLIYEIYDKSQFMNKQFRNPGFYKSVEQTSIFNTEPFYISKSEQRNITKT